jgi:hypothetical protein
LFHPFDFIHLLGKRRGGRYERRAQLHSEVSSGKIHDVVDCQLLYSANLAAHHFGEFARWIRTKIDCVNNRRQLRRSAVSFREHFAFVGGLPRLTGLPAR